MSDLADVPQVRDKLKVGLRRAFPVSDGMYRVEVYHECSCPNCDKYGHWLREGSPVSLRTARQMVEERRR